jgi:hypothetical protein
MNDNKKVVHTSDDFVSVLIEFLDQMTTVFNDCPRCHLYKNALQTKLNHLTGSERSAFVERAYTQYHNVMLPFYERCSRRDETLLDEDIELVEKLDLRAKWTDNLDAQTKSAIWTYIGLLNQIANFLMTGEIIVCERVDMEIDSAEKVLMSDEFAVFRTFMPTNIISKVGQQMDLMMRENPSSFEPSNVMTMTMRILNTMTPDDMEAMRSNVHQNMDGLKQLSEMMGPLLLNQRRQ